MAFLKYADDAAIRVKITELFEYRKLTALLHMSGLDADPVFVGQLHDLQFQIYQLDAYLESQWILDPKILALRWASMHDALSVFYPSKKKQEKLFREIRVYEAIEKGMRKDCWPTRVSFKKFYTTKSCDVRLIRMLIYAAAPSLKKSWPVNAWVYYDRITEINDDICDVPEDLLTYNGNRFLISILRKSISRSHQLYNRYLQKVTRAAQRYFSKAGKHPNTEQLYVWTMTRADETEALLRARMTEIEPEIYAQSVLLEHMQ